MGSCKIGQTQSRSLSTIGCHRHVPTPAVAQATVQIGGIGRSANQRSPRWRGARGACRGQIVDLSERKASQDRQIGVEPEAPIELVELNDPILLGCVIELCFTRQLEPELGAGGEQQLASLLVLRAIAKASREPLTGASPNRSCRSAARGSCLEVRSAARSGQTNRPPAGAPRDDA